MNHTCYLCCTSENLIHDKVMDQRICGRCLLGVADVQGRLMIKRQDEILMLQDTETTHINQLLAAREREIELSHLVVHQARKIAILEGASGMPTPMAEEARLDGLTEES